MTTREDLQSMYERIHSGQVQLKDRRGRPHQYGSRGWAGPGRTSCPWPTGTWMPPCRST
jgi:hypothetical protein